MTLGDLRTRLKELDGVPDDVTVLMSKDKHCWYYKELDVVASIYFEAKKEQFIVLIPESSL